MTIEQDDNLLAHLETLNPDEVEALKTEFGDDEISDMTLGDIHRASVEAKEEPEQKTDGEQAASADDGQAAESAQIAPASAADSGTIPNETIPQTQPATTPAADAATQGQEQGRDFAQELKTLDARLDELAAAFDDGELTAAEYEQQRRAVSDERGDVRADMRRAKEAEEQAQARLEQEKQAWFTQCDTFVNQTNKAFYLSANGQPNSVRIGALDSMVRALGVAEPHLSNAQVLEKAHAQVLAEFGQPAKDAQAEPAEQATPAKAAPKLPPNLGAVPTAETETPAGSDPLDRLTGDEAEAALMKMTPAQRDAWLRR
ncbi:hypothetical protein CEK28_08470 [Xenophilus sp. AP218F]|nr:hypothetical protein CEK28_08470 [Xenophilus sp. AP218F]